MDSLAGPGGAAKGNPASEFLGVTHYWRYSKERMQQWYAQGSIVQTKPGGVPAYTRYLDETPGVAWQDVWNDGGLLQASSAERLGWKCQNAVHSGFAD